MSHTPLEQKRLAWKPPIPPQLVDLSQVSLQPHGEAAALAEPLKKLFPHTQGQRSFCIKKSFVMTKRFLRVGVFFSGGQAAGGHNVLSGLFDALPEKSSLIGFLDGPAGLLENRRKILDQSLIDSVRNLGGFDLIGSSRTKIETNEQLEAAAQNAQDLDALIVIGGDDSNTNAAILAEYFLAHKVKCCVIGVPKTIDGDLRSQEIEISFGFDSACKTYSELIGNIERDALSAKKYTHFIKLMGRSASHIALECALITHPNLTLIGEERQSLEQMISQIVTLILERRKAGKEYGVILIPEGLIEFVPELGQLIQALNREKDPQKLPSEQRRLFSTLPETIQKQLLLEKDPHGNVQVSQIETEQILIELVKRKLEGSGVKLNAMQHFFGYEGRACYPTNFDATYAYALGRLAALAARDRLTGVILAIRHLRKKIEEWEPLAIPILHLMHFEMRKEKQKPVIAKALVDLTGPLYQRFVKEREQWRIEDHYSNPGPVQFFGDSLITDSCPITISYCL